MRKTLSNDEFVVYRSRANQEESLRRKEKKLAKIRKTEPYYQKEHKKTSKLKK